MARAAAGRILGRVVPPSTPRLSTVLIAAPPGLWRGALASFVRAVRGAEPVTADTPEQAAGLALTRPGAAVIVDAAWGAAGVELVQRLRAAGGQALLIAALDTPAQASTYYRAGADLTLVKGFLDDDLRAALAAVPPAASSEVRS